MKINKLQHININSDNTLQNLKSKNNLPKNSISKKAPVDPIYWQNITFAGKKQNELQDLLNKAKKNNDQDLIEFYDILSSNNFSYYADDDSLCELLKEKNPTKIKMAKYFNTSLWSPFLYLSRFMENAELFGDKDFEKFTFYADKKYPNDKEEIKYLFEQTRYFVNPKTRLFDIELLKLYGKLEEKYNKKDSRYSSYDVMSKVSSFVNPKTGEIDDKLVECAEKYYFSQLDTTDSNKIKAGSLDLLCTILKDKNGAYNEQNEKMFLKIARSKKAKFLLSGEMTGAVRKLKNKDGIIDAGKLKSVIKNAEFLNNKKSYIVYSNDLSSSRFVEGYLDALNLIGIEESEEFLKNLTDIFENKYSAVKTIGYCAQYCYDEEGQKIKGKTENLSKYAKYISDDALCYEEIASKFFNIIDNEDDGSFLAKITEKQAKKLSSREIKHLYTYLTKENKTSSFYKEKMLGAVDENLSLETASDIFKESETDEGEFDEKFFKLACEIYRLKEDKEEDFWFGIEDLKDFVDKDCKNIEKLSPTEKLAFLTAFKPLLFNEKYTSDSDFKFVAPLVKILEADLAKTNIAMRIDEDSKKDFLNSILGNKKNKNEKLTGFEKTIQNSTQVFNDMKTGLPLSYKREEFLKDLSGLLNQYPDDVKNYASEKLGITFNSKDGEIKDYNGIINLKALNLDNEFENKVYKICHKFLYENEIQSGDINLDFVLNKLIKGMPEFINLVGKKKDDKTYDIDVLLTLSNLFKNPNYQNLNNKDKLILKSVLILSDISADSSLDSENEAIVSATYSKNIMPKFLKEKSIIQRISSLVYENARLRDLNTYIEAANHAYELRYPSDFENLKLLLLSHDNEILKNPLVAVALSVTKETIERINSSGNAIFTDYPLSFEKLRNCEEEFYGHKYKVINFHDIEDDEDMGKYGFLSGKTKDDLIFLVHMIYDDKNLEDFKTALKSLDGGVMSESLITPRHSNTFSDRKTGLLLKEKNPNVISTAKSDSNSGNEKGKTTALELMFDKYYTDGHRKDFKINLLKNLDIDSNKVKDVEFAEFYKNNLASINYLSQIKDEALFKLGNKEFDGKTLKNAIQKYQDSLIYKKEYGHNEIVGIGPEIKGLVAKAKGLDELSNEFLKFARENDLPILLI